MNSTLLLIKILNKAPVSFMKVFGYSNIGSKIVSVFRKDSKVYYNIEHGVKIFLDITNPLTWQLILGHDIEHKTKNIFLENISMYDTVIDVGAHIGEYSLIAMKKMGNTGQVISIEPLDDGCKWLQNNISINNFTNHNVMQCAVGSKSGLMTLYRNSVNGPFGYLESIVNGKKLCESTKVKMTTIDEILEKNNIQNVDMLKIDVEGFEYDVLIGCLHSFKTNKIQKIICEVHLEFLEKKRFDKNKIYSLLLDNGFSLKIINQLKSKKTIHILAQLSNPTIN